MKHLFIATIVSWLLTGCGTMYNPNAAPVVNRNTPYGQRPVAVTPVYRNSQTPAPVVAIRPPQVQRPIAVAPVPVRPVVIAAPREQTQIVQSSPYQTTLPQPAPRNVNTIDNNDGWNVSAKPPAAVIVAEDVPKLDTAPAQIMKETGKENVQTNTASVGQNVTTPENTAAGEVNNALPEPLRPKVNENNTGITPANTTTTEDKTTTALRPPVTGGSSGETAVSSLLKKASASLGKGDLEGAAAYLENAQRIEPKNSKILYDIANIRYHQGRFKDAESLAGKAVRTGGSNSMLKKSWTLISNARTKLGDSQGAMQAGEMAAQF